MEMGFPQRSSGYLHRISQGAIRWRWASPREAWAISTESRVPPISTEEEAAAIVAALEALPLAHARAAGARAGAGAGTRRRVLPLFAFLEALDIPKGTKGTKGTRGAKGSRKTPGRIIWSHLEASSAKKSTSPLSTSSTPLPKLPKSLPCEISGQRSDTQGLLLRDVPALLEAYLPLEARHQYLIENSAVSNAIAAALSRAAGEEDGGGAAAAMEEARGRTRKEWAAKLEREQALQLPELLEGMGPLAIRTSTNSRKPHRRALRERRRHDSDLGRCP